MYIAAVNVFILKVGKTNDEERNHIIAPIYWCLIAEIDLCKFGTK